MNYKLLAVDDQGKECNVDLKDLIEHITNQVLKQMPNSYKLSSGDEWMAKEGYFFKRKVLIPTNIGAYEKVNSTPAIIGFGKFKDSNGVTVGRLIFMSKERRGCVYRSPDGKQHPNPKESDGWFYNITQEDIRPSDDTIKVFANLIFESEQDALDGLLQTAHVRPAQYFSVFPTDGDILLALGCNFEDDVMNAPVIFDKEGNLWCNGVFNRDGKEVSS